MKRAHLSGAAARLLKGYGQNRGFLDRLALFMEFLGQDCDFLDRFSSTIGGLHKRAAGRWAVPAGPRGMGGWNRSRKS